MFKKLYGSSVKNTEQKSDCLTPAFVSHCLFPVILGRWKLVKSERWVQEKPHTKKDLEGVVFICLRCFVKLGNLGLWKECWIRKETEKGFGRGEETRNKSSLSSYVRCSYLAFEKTIMFFGGETGTNIIWRSYREVRNQMTAKQNTSKTQQKNTNKN